MSIDVAQRHPAYSLSPSRLGRIFQAKSEQDASAMNLLDRIIDYVFRSNAKRDSIRKVYAIVAAQRDAPIADAECARIGAFLLLRGMAQPRYRDMFELNLTEHPNGTCDYALIIDGQTLHARRDIHDQQEIARLRQACQRMKVDDYLLSLQQHKDDAMSLIPAGEPLSIKQGKTGDCYALVVMIGALSSPIVQESILNSAEITERGALRLTFNANIHSPMGRQKVLRGEPPETLAKVLADRFEIHNLKKKGYALALENGQLQVDISPSRLRRIIDHPRSASTNSLMVKILEHLAGNLMQNGQSPLRSNRDSIDAHNQRADNYDPLIGNLLGYGTALMYGPTNTEGLSMILERAAARGCCLEDGSPRFLFVGCAYGQPDPFGNMHFHHAFVLDSVGYDMTGKAVSMTLVNPWDNLGERFVLTLDEAMKRDVAFAEYARRGTPLDPRIPMLP